MYMTHPPIKVCSKVTSCYSCLVSVIPNMQTLPVHLTLAPIYLSQGEKHLVTGTCDAWVTGVDFAIHVSMSVVPGRVFT